MHAQGRAVASFVLMVGVGWLAPPAAAETPRDALAKAYAACVDPLGPVELPKEPEPDAHSHQLTITRDGAAFTIDEAYLGNGREALHGGTIERFDSKRCTRIAVDWSTQDGSGIRPVKVRAFGPITPSVDDIAQALGVAVPHPKSAHHAFGRAWFAHRPGEGPDAVCTCADDAECGATQDRPWGLGEVVAPAQPWHAGRPRPSEGAYWDKAALAAIGVDNVVSMGADPEPTDGFIAPVVGKAKPGLRVGRYQLFEAPALGGRNDARAIAIYDHWKNRHRWVMVTRGCVSGTTVRLGPNDTRFIVGEARNRNYRRLDTAFAIDLKEGVARRIWRDGDCDLLADEVPNVLEPTRTAFALKCGEKTLTKTVLADVRALWLARDAAKAQAK